MALLLNPSAPLEALQGIAAMLAGIPKMGSVGATLSPAIASQLYAAHKLGTVARSRPLPQIRQLHTVALAAKQTMATATQVSPCLHKVAC